MAKKRKKASRTKPRKRKKAAPRRTAPGVAAVSPARKPRKTLFDLPPLELECMKALWSLTEAGSGTTTVREIREVVAGNHRRLAYTTVETIMDRLTRKGVVRRQKQGRAHHYTAVYQLDQARAEGVRTLLKHFFGGSRRALQAHMAGTPLTTTMSHRPVRTPSSSARGGPKPAASPRKKDSPIDTSLL